MVTIDQLEAFVAAARSGSFSAAARQLKKAQSTVSNGIINLEIDLDLQLFDRSARSPVLTPSGLALLEYAETILRDHKDFTSHATSLTESGETSLCLAIEQSVWSGELLPILTDFEREFPYVTLELLDPGTGDVGLLVQQGRADLGMMVAQETSPQGFHFQGIGHSKLITVCSSSHPLVHKQPVKESDLRQYRQLITYSRDSNDQSFLRRRHSPRYWLLESPHVALELVVNGIGWAMLNCAVVEEKVGTGDLVSLRLGFEKTNILQGIDVIWSKNRNLGKAGYWLKNRLQNLVIV